MEWLRGFFATQQRQAIGWATLGVMGVVMLATGVIVYAAGGDPSPPASRANRDTASLAPAPSRAAGVTTGASPSVASSVSASPSASPSPEESPSPSPTATATARQAQNPSSGGGNPTATPTPIPPTPTEVIPTATPTQPAAAAVYCSSPGGGGVPPNAIFGALKINGVDAPVGTTVSLAFDGVIGTSTRTTTVGGYRFFYGGGGGDCLNRAGAAISIVVNGKSFPTGQTVASSNIAIAFSIDVR